MKRIVLLIGLIIFPSIAFASVDKPPAIALENYLKSQGKMNGASVRTRQLPDGSYEVFEWKVQGIPKPTDEQINQIISDYDKQPKIETLEERVTNLESKVK